MIRSDVRETKWGDALSAALSFGRRPYPTDDLTVRTHSGKAALNHVFSHLRASRVLLDKNSKILVPSWLGYWVYNAMRPHGFPVLHDDPDIKVVVVYHQYGFPQDLDSIFPVCADRKIAVVEDCAHALDGRYKGRPLGTEGLAGVFSFSKFFPSLVGGAVRSQDPALRAHVAAREEAGSALLGHLSFAVKLAVSRRPSSPETSMRRRLLEAAYASYPHCRRVAWAERIGSSPRHREELSVRRRNYSLYRALLSDHDELQRLEADATPYVVPLMHPKRTVLEKTGAELRAAGFDTGIYSFDANRNLFSPRYVPSLWLPVHGGVGESDIERIAQIVMRNR